KGAVTRVAKDETPRETSLESLAALKPAFTPDGTVTVGNASKLNDGAAALVIAGAARARELGAAPLARIVAQAQYAREPDLFLLAPSGAIAGVLDKAGGAAAGVDLYGGNEAFSGGG